MRTLINRWSDDGRPMEETWLVPLIGMLGVLVLLWY